MTSDHRITPGLITDVLDALERHGYCRGNDLHADRAIGLVGDPACIYEGTQDHPATAARKRAIAGNWCAPAALDDDQLDTPGYRPRHGWKPATGTGVAPEIRPPARRRRPRP